MPNLNVEISEAAIKAAKAAANRAGMKLKTWVERSLMDAATAHERAIIDNADRPVSRERYVSLEGE